MKRFRTYKYALLPTKEQKELIKQICNNVDGLFNELVQYVNWLHEEGETLEAVQAKIDCFNRCLAENVAATKAVKKEVQKLLPALYCGAIPEIKPRNSNRSKRSFDCERTAIQLGCIEIPTIGILTLNYHRPLPDEAHVYRVVICELCHGAKYEVAVHVLLETIAQASWPMRYSNMIGLDYAQDGLYVASNGDRGGYPGFHQKVEHELLRHRKAAMRFTVGSSRWVKHQQRAAKLERHIANQRKDWQYKTAHRLSDTYDAVCMETLDLVKMQSYDPRLRKKICDNAAATFQRRLESVLQAQGKSLICISPVYPSSQLCCVCGYWLGKLPLSERVITCPHCNTRIDRDINAAINIRNEGARQLELAS